MSERRVHLWPARDAFIPGVPAAEYTVTPDVADRLLEYQPPAFHRSRPDWWEGDRAATDDEVAALERFLDAPPAEAADNQTPEASQGASTDSEEPV